MEFWASCHGWVSWMSLFPFLLAVSPFLAQCVYASMGFWVSRMSWVSFLSVLNPFLCRFHFPLEFLFVGWLMVENFCFSLIFYVHFLSLCFLYLLLSPSLLVTEWLCFFCLSLILWMIKRMSPSSPFPSITSFPRVCNQGVADGNGEESWLITLNFYLWFEVL